MSEDELINIWQFYRLARERWRQLAFLPVSPEQHPVESSRFRGIEHQNIYPDSFGRILFCFLFFALLEV